ncbi:DUF4011 domain-containing protein [Streptomyces sp. NPDC057798]|uniref:DUF4011 domain-containing protein n=1 Tax=Streptomyces sp. NPDC057798 TaxID=3346252 RepID=UPI0036B7A14F
MTNSGAFEGSQEIDCLKAMLEGWRSSLVDLSGRNRLLNFRHTRSATLEISVPSAPELLKGLGRGWDFAPLPDEEPEADEGRRNGDAVLEKVGERTERDRHSEDHRAFSPACAEQSANQSHSGLQRLRPVDPQPRRRHAPLV